MIDYPDAREVAHEHLKYARYVLRSCIPLDLCDKQVYLFDEEDFAQWARFRKHDPAYQADTVGFTSGLLDMKCKPWLEARGQWEGRGFITFIAAKRIGEEFEKVAVERDWTAHRLLEVVRQYIACVVLHEACHWLDAKESLFADEIVSTMQDEIDAIPFALEERPKMMPWRSHDTSFIRFAIHMMFRTGYQGFNLLWNGFNVAGEPYGLSPLACYRSALGNEPLRFIDAPLIALRLIHPPKAFLDLFEEDKERYLASLAEPVREPVPACTPSLAACEVVT